MALREAGWLAGWLPQTTGTHDIYIRVLVEMMGSQKYDNAGESQSSLIMNDPIISPRTRIGLPNPRVGAHPWPRRSLALCGRCGGGGGGGSCSRGSRIATVAVFCLGVMPWAVPPTHRSCAPLPWPSSSSSPSAHASAAWIAWIG
jgi:hypothetical protein